MASGTVLITGIAGFTGFHLAAELREAGYRVAGTVAPGHLPSAPDLHTCDLTDPAAVREVVAEVRPDRVVHLAAISSVAHKDNQAFYRVNVLGTMHLLEALGAEGIASNKVLLASSAQVYGSAARDVVDESICPRPVNHYAASKLAMEHLAATWFDRLPIVIARPFNYTGVGQTDSFLIPKIVDHFANRQDRIELGNLFVEREFNDVRAVCRIYRLLLESDARGESFNVCSGIGHALMSIVGALEKIAKRSIKVDVNPAFVRPNELPRLIGSKAKLESAIGPVEFPQIEQTLTLMYESALG